MHEREGKSGRRRVNAFTGVPKCYPVGVRLDRLLPARSQRCTKRIECCRPPVRSRMRDRDRIAARGSERRDRRGTGATQEMIGERYRDDPGFFTRAFAQW